MNTAKTYREMAEDIRRTALGFPEEPERFECVTRHGTRLSCINSKEAISRLAGKYERAAKRNPLPSATNKPSNTGFSFSAALNRFIEDQEIENAISFAESCKKPIYFFAGKTPWPLKSAQLLGDERFVVGNTGSAWSVTHLASGKATGRGANKKEALADHSQNLSKRTKEEIEALLQQAPCDFQATAKSHFTSLSGGDLNQAA